MKFFAGSMVTEKVGMAEGLEAESSAQYTELQIENSLSFLHLIQR